MLKNKCPWFLNGACYLSYLDDSC